MRKAWYRDSESDPDTSERRRTFFQAEQQQHHHHHHHDDDATNQIMSRHKVEHHQCCHNDDDDDDVVVVSVNDHHQHGQQSSSCESLHAVDVKKSCITVCMDGNEGRCKNKGPGWALSPKILLIPTFNEDLDASLTSTPSRSVSKAPSLSLSLHGEARGPLSVSGEGRDS